MSNKIKHNGVVDGVEEGCVRVRILQSSACSACKVAAHCNASETKEKIIEVQVVLMLSSISWVTLLLWWQIRLLASAPACMAICCLCS